MSRVLSETSPEYDALPAAIKHSIPFKYWAWMSEESKARLVQDECEPEA